MKVISVRRVPKQRVCARCGKSCYGSYEAVLETGGSLPLCSNCQQVVAAALAEGEVVDIPLKSARI